MERTEIILLAVALAFAGVRLYQKYIKKNQAGSGKKGMPGSSLSSSTVDDDYEPYSKK